MAFLTKISSQDERRVFLFVEHTIGRSPTCKLVLTHKSVSSFHACVRWHDDAWQLRDLGSRNGTFLNGQRVRERPHALRRGDRIVLGDQEETWVFADDARPQAMLIPVIGVHGDDETGGEPSSIPTGGNDSQSLILGDLRAFPSDENPQVTIFQDAEGRFFLEGVDGDSEELVAEQHVCIGNTSYWLFVPGTATGLPTTRQSGCQVVESSVRTMRLTLKVAPDEETAAAVIEAGAVQAELKPRVHLYLLVHLARLRVEEEQEEAEGAGWVSVEVLCDDLQLTREQLGLQVFRIRDDMKKIGLSDAAEIVDRRRRGWIRMGVSAAQIRLGRM